MSAEAGAFIAKVATEANLRISMSWKRSVLTYGVSSPAMIAQVAKAPMTLVQYP